MMHKSDKILQFLSQIICMKCSEAPKNYSQAQWMIDLWYLVPPPFRTIVQSYWYNFSVDHNLTLTGLLLCNQVLEANPSCYLQTSCCEKCQWVCCVNTQCVVTNLCTVFPCIFNTFSSHSMLLSSKQLPCRLIQWVKHACHCRKPSGNPVLWKLQAHSSILFGMQWGKQVPSLYVGICWQQKKVEWT